MSEEKRAARLRELDALRGLAALAVLLYHYTYFIGEPLPSLQVELGHVGVPLFLGISGFVITTSLARVPSVSAFARARAIRLLPTYWLGMLVTSAVVLLTAPGRFEVPAVDVPANVAMVQLLVGARMIDGAYWTLNVELFFYICMAAAWRLGLLRRLDFLVMGWLGLSFAWMLASSAGSAARWLLVIDYVPFFAVGMIASQIWSGEKSLKEQLLLFALPTVITLATQPESVGAIFVNTIVLLLVGTGHLQRIAVAPLLWLGRISYPLYLTHGVIGYCLIPKLHEAGLTPIRPSSS